MQSDRVYWVFAEVLDGPPFEEARNNDNGRGETAAKEFAYLEAGEIYGCDADMRGFVDGVGGGVGGGDAAHQAYAGTRGDGVAVGVWRDGSDGLLADVWRRERACGMVADERCNNGA